MGERTSGWARTPVRGLASLEDRHFQRLLEQLPAAAYTCDCDGLITYYNQTAAETWGRCPALRDSADRYCGSFRLWTPEGELLLHEASWMAMALENRQGYNGHEVVVERPDGSRRHVLVHANPYYDDSGALLGAVNVLFDVSAERELDLERERLRARAIESQRMESLGAFASGMAHELNNVLTIMLGSAELVRRDQGRPDSRDRVLRHVDEIQNAGARAKALLHQVLNFSRKPGASGPQILSLVSLVEQTSTLLRSTLGRELTLETHVDGLTPYIHGDAAQLQQAMFNLCSNAAQALKGRRGHVRITVEPVRVDASSAVERILTPGLYARLSVADNGVGIEDSIKPRIFEPFFSTRPVGDGTGLGLSVVHGIIEDHGGAIEVHSRAGYGSTFALYFPEAPAP